MSSKEVKKVWSKMALVVDGELQPTLCNDYGDIEEVITDMLTYTGQSVDDLKARSFKIVNLIGEPLSQEQEHFTVDFVTERPYIGEANENCTDEVEYEVEDTGKTFDDIEDLKEYLIDLIDSGEYDTEDVERFTINQTLTNTIDFQDHVFSGDTKAVISFPHGSIGERILNEYHGRCYIRREDIDQLVNEKLNIAIKTQLNDADLVNIRRDPQELTDLELVEEMSVLQERLFALQTEKKNRKERQDEGGCNVGHIGINPNYNV